ncbi:hypothetical protein FRB99_000684, partial [Tulasnella sp. 403]
MRVREKCSPRCVGLVRQWDVAAAQEDTFDASCTTHQVSPTRETATTLSISPDNTWFAIVSANNGDVFIKQSRDSKSPPPVGKVPADGTIWRGVSLGPMSNSASGLVAGGGGGLGTGVAVYKYASWDFTGAYLT